MVGRIENGSESENDYEIVIWSASGNGCGEAT